MTRLARRAVVAVGLIGLVASVLAACGSSGGGGGRVTLNFYNFPDNSGAVQQAADDCSAQSGGKYRIKYNKLPNGADGQRQQMVRRLAAHDKSMDILGLDVTWESEFAEAGWIREWTGDAKAQAEDGTLDAALQTATVNGKLYAVPYNTNTQLLWYRSDLVPNPPKTWDEMITMATDLARQGKPHLIEIQGAQYEGVVVWFNTLVASAGGSILTPDANSAALGQPAIDALAMMQKLAHSPAADPSLSVQMEDANRLAMESGSAAFELNYPFVYPSMLQNKPDLAKNFKWTQYPSLKPGEPSHVTIGGIDMAISKYSKHPDLAFQAALCLRNRDNQLIAAVKGGLPPTLEGLYTNPPDTKIPVKDSKGKVHLTTFTQSYPMYQDIYQALKTASVRPKTPAYQNVSIVISHAVSPPTGINPAKTENKIRDQLKDALTSKGLIP